MEWKKVLVLNEGVRTDRQRRAENKKSISKCDFFFSILAQLGHVFGPLEHCKHSRALP